MSADDAATFRNDARRMRQPTTTETAYDDDDRLGLAQLGDMRRLSRGLSPISTGWAGDLARSHLSPHPSVSGDH